MAVPAEAPGLDEHHGLLFVQVLGMDGSEVLSAALPPEATVLDLHEKVFEAAGVSRLAQRLVHQNSVLQPSSSSLAAAGVRSGALVTLVVTPPAVEYRVMQGILVKKCGADPKDATVHVQLERRVGYKVRTTGHTWTGPAGGLWVEQDPSASARPGWLLVEGPVDGPAGPLLEKVSVDEAEARIMYVRSPADDNDTKELCLRPSMTLGEAKRWIACRLPGLAPNKIVIVKKRRAHRSVRFTPEGWILADTLRIKDLPFGDGEELPYLYLGDADDYNPELNRGLCEFGPPPASDAS